MGDTSTSYHILCIQLNGNSSAVRHLYLKPYVGQDSLPKDRALFVTGLPVEMDEEALLRLFSKYGEIERAAIHGSRVSAVVLYATKKARDRVIKTADKGSIVELTIPPCTRAFGLKRWVEMHKAEKPGNDELRRRLDKWMEEYEEEEARRKAEAVAAMEDDGWTVVQRQKGRKKSTSESGATVGAMSAAAARAAEQKKQPALHHNFYRFQQRERRRQGETNSESCIDDFRTISLDQTSPHCFFSVYKTLYGSVLYDTRRFVGSEREIRAGQTAIDRIEGSTTI